MSVADRKKLRLVLEGAPSHADFLEDVKRAMQALGEVECPEGFRLLDEAIEAFEASEFEDGDEDDEDEDDQDDDDEEEEAG
jgi:hypothetical protein